MKRIEKSALCAERHTVAVYDGYAREPVIRRMPDGTLLVTALTGGAAEPSNDNVTAFCKSEDNGKTWTKPEILFSHHSRGVWCTEICTEFAKPACVVHTYNAATHYLELVPFLSRSDDGGKTWGKPAVMAGGMSGCSVRQGITMSNGEVLFPVYWQEAADTFERFDMDDPDWPLNHGKSDGGAHWPFRCGVAVTADGGQTFSRFGYLSARDSLWENNCIELEDGHILMLMRNNNAPFLARADSFDCGRTWTAPATSDIPNPNAKFSLQKVRGRQVMVNNFAERGRQNLELRVSRDGFASFDLCAELEAPAESWFYPHIYADDALQKLFVTYENMKEHRLLIVDYDEIL